MLEPNGVYLDIHKDTNSGSIKDEFQFLLKMLEEKKLKPYIDTIFESIKLLKHTDMLTKVINVDMWFYKLMPNLCDIIFTVKKESERLMILNTQLVIKSHRLFCHFQYY